MTPTAFAVQGTTFLTHSLAAQRKLRPKTLKASRAVLTLLLRSCREVRGMVLEKLSLAQIDVALVEAFLQYLAQERQSAIGTRNHRLAALHAFCRYVQAEPPPSLWPCQQILAIPLRRYARPPVGYRSKDLWAALLAPPDLHTHDGRRDAVLLRVLYDTGARVQEVSELSAGAVRLEPPAQVRRMGQGRKRRAVPLMEATVPLLRDHRGENGLDRPEHLARPLFQNRQGERFSRSGVRYVLQQYVQAVRRAHPDFSHSVSPHHLRHPKGMPWLQSGVSLEIIRDFLGHVEVNTTQMYVRANREMKRKALEKISAPSPVPTLPSWQENKTRLAGLQSL
jgi:site-specific recombinase XerD